MVWGSFVAFRPHRSEWNSHLAELAGWRGVSPLLMLSVILREPVIDVKSRGRRSSSRVNSAAADPRPVGRRRSARPGGTPPLRPRCM